jgi:hypothetical protein
LSAWRTVKPGPDAFGKSFSQRVELGQEVIMTGKRKVFGSQDFFALDIPVT